MSYQLKHTVKKYAKIKKGTNCLYTKQTIFNVPKMCLF